MMMKKSLQLCLFSLLFLFFNHTHLYVHSLTFKKEKKNNKTRQLEQESNYDDIDCIDLADFYYEIILGVTSFPEQGDCSQQEDTEIAALLQNSINTELQAIPGTINTQNKICDNPINDRRRFLTSSSNGSLTEKQNHDKERKVFNTTLNATSQYSLTEEDERILVRTRQRSFIYIGGGRCRFCFYDNADKRELSSTVTVVPATIDDDQFLGKSKEDRDLMYLSHLEPKTPLPKVADVLLCKQSIHHAMFVRKTRDVSIHWINRKSTSFFHKKFNRGFHNRVGPYMAGDNFGVQFDMKEAMRVQSNKIKKRFKKNAKMVNIPVKEGTIHFWLYAFDLPAGFTTGILPDDPLILFINGIKLDFALLMSQPGATMTQKTSYTEILEGSSFAGIRWKIRRMYTYGKDFGFGSQPDGLYVFEITAPLVVLQHKNQLDLDFIIKPSAKAKRYVFDSINTRFTAALCEVTGIENSPFEEFQSVVESRLFHKLGMDLAREFQNKQGHCLYDKIPVVNVHLVEKESWKESNPQCDQE